MKIIFKFRMLLALLALISFDNFAQEDCDATCKYERYMAQKDKKNKPSSTLRDYGSYQCVSRDRDGIEPYAVAVDGDFDYVNTPLVFDRENECLDALDKDLFVVEGYEDYPAICATQDSDGIGPYGVFILDISSGDITSIDMVYEYMQECETAMEEIIYDDEMPLTCASVDADGIAPWGIMNLDDGSILNEFDTFDGCMNNLLR